MKPTNFDVIPIMPHLYELIEKILLCEISSVLLNNVVITELIVVSTCTSEPVVQVSDHTER